MGKKEKVAEERKSSRITVTKFIATITLATDPSSILRQPVCPFSAAKCTAVLQV